MVQDPSRPYRVPCLQLTATPEWTFLLTPCSFHSAPSACLQLTATPEQALSVDHYINKTFYKTASLMANSCKAVAVLGEHSPTVCQAAWEYGRHLGLAFQVSTCRWNLLGMVWGRGTGCRSRKVVLCLGVLHAWQGGLDISEHRNYPRFCLAGVTIPQSNTSWATS